MKSGRIGGIQPTMRTTHFSVSFQIIRRAMLSVNVRFDLTDFGVDSNLQVTSSVYLRADRPRVVLTIEQTQALDIVS